MQNLPLPHTQPKNMAFTIPGAHVLYYAGELEAKGDGHVGQPLCSASFAYTERDLPS